jgi:hypothetical protein
MQDSFRSNSATGSYTTPKSGEPLAQVLATAKTTALAHLARSFERDATAVQAALDLPWTTSPVEGQINRIKTVKRTMYGRAGFPLLCRVSSTPPNPRQHAKRGRASYDPYHTFIVMCITP